MIGRELNRGTALGSRQARIYMTPSVSVMLGMIASYVLVAVFFWTSWGQGWPVGSFWWDELALAGASEAIHAGMVPTVDYWAPFILPLYLKYWAVILVGHGGAYVAECLMQGAIVLLLFCWLVGRKYQTVYLYLVGYVVVFAAIAPFNLLTVSEALLGYAGFSCAYNRLGGSLIALVLLLVGVRQDGQRDKYLICWLAVVFVLAFLLKVTVLQISWSLILMRGVVSPGQGWLRLLFWASLVAVTILCGMAWLGGGASGYLSALKYLSEVRLSLLWPNIGFLLGLLVFEHRFELAVLLLLGLLAAMRGSLSKIPWLAQLLWFLLACVAVSAYTSSNYGDNGMMPAIGATFVLLRNRGLKEPALSIPVQVRRLERLLLALSQGLVGLLVAFYVALICYWTFSLFTHSRQSEAIHVPVRAHHLASNYVIEQGAWSKRPDMVSADLPIDLRSPGVYASYLEGLDEAYIYLDTHVPDRSTKVYALDFPAYVFSLIGGYQVPRNSFPWLLFGHEITMDHHPEAKLLLADVEILLISKCSASGDNRRWLYGIYRVYIEKNFRREGVLSCWDIYRRGAL